VPPHISLTRLKRPLADLDHGLRTKASSVFITVQTNLNVEGSSHSSDAARVILQMLTVLGVKVLAELGYILTLLLLKM
jgi:hypothetical protein